MRNWTKKEEKKTKKKWKDRFSHQKHTHKKSLYNRGELTIYSKAGRRDVICYYIAYDGFEIRYNCCTNISCIALSFFCYHWTLHLFCWKCLRRFNAVSLLLLCRYQYIILFLRIMYEPTVLMMTMRITPTGETDKKNEWYKNKKIRIPYLDMS